MKQIQFTYPSATGLCGISAEKYLPEQADYDTVLVIHHGMAEHRQRYLPFIRFMTEHGTAVYMHDMASHGQSALPSGVTGFFGEKDGDRHLVEDFRTLVLRARSEQPGRRLVVMGHSMGSFICRLYLSRFPEDRPDAAIIMGTGGKNPAAGAGLAAAALIGALRGKQHKSSLLNTLAFGSYGKRFEGRTGFDWLTRDTAIVDRYIADPLCGYLFTARGMYDLVTVNRDANLPAWYEAVPKKLPILLISGEEDPVGDYGKGVREVAEQLNATGHTAVTLKLYPGARHEVLNETNRDQVMADLLGWMKKTDDPDNCP